ncbi:hypothetical protein LSH36_129g01074 [Paralvinella palmiformis]|uniref:Uncharacterized protein n=1 Tax=Paralvinella palmiformis TaxID=53620 RepID=A0AAD9JYK7_9ANNE|nr:hypothetical protein LSH36_129g01074 [Paralvinella palmiformis]
MRSKCLRTSYSVLLKNVFWIFYLLCESQY